MGFLVFLLVVGAGGALLWLVFGGGLAALSLPTLKMDSKKGDAYSAILCTIVCGLIACVFPYSLIIGVPLCVGMWAVARQ